MRGEGPAHGGIGKGPAELDVRGIGLEESAAEMEGFAMEGDRGRKIAGLQFRIAEGGNRKCEIEL